MLVRIVKNWTNPDILRQTPEHSGIWEGIEFTEKKVKECDLLVVLNAPNYPLTIKCREKWLLSQESPIDYYEWHKRSFEYFDKVFSFWNDPHILHDQTSLPWHINKSFDELNLLTEKDLGSKKNEVSWVTSNYNNKPGHQLRMQLLSILKEQNFKFDLFGKGFNPIDDKFEGIFPYKYSIAIENYSCNDYWTEKIADCFLSWTMPVYYGCSNITKYFPEEAMVLIDPAKPDEAMAIITKAMAEGRWEKNILAIKEARELVMNEYQFFPSIAKKIKAYQSKMHSKKWYHVPENLQEQEPNPRKIKFETLKAKLKNLYA